MQSCYVEKSLNKQEKKYEIPILRNICTGRSPILVNICCPLKNSVKRKTLQEQDLNTPVKAWKTSQDLLPIQLIPTMLAKNHTRRLAKTTSPSSRLSNFNLGIFEALRLQPRHLQGSPTSTSPSSRISDFGTSPSSRLSNLGTSPSSGLSKFGTCSSRPIPPSPVLTSSPAAPPGKQIGVTCCRCNYISQWIAV